jgi:hypothetical protein
MSTAGEAVSEFAFNKINSLISQSNIKHFDLTIRSFNDFSASFRVKERLVLTGSLFNTSTGSSDLFQKNAGSIFNSNFNQLTRDFDAQYLIQKNGNLTARYSYRVLNSTTLTTLNQLGIQYVNGLGLVYQRDFDTFGEFIRNLFSTGGKKNPVKPAPVSTPTINSSPGTNTRSDQEDDQ